MFNFRPRESAGIIRFFTVFSAEDPEGLRHIFASDAGDPRRQGAGVEQERHRCVLTVLIVKFAIGRGLYAWLKFVCALTM
jgi:hypothetical protein